MNRTPGHPLFWLSLLAVLLLLEGASPLCAAPPPLRVAAEEHPPYTYQDEQGVPRGLLVELWERWSLRNGRPVSFDVLPWQEAVDRVLEGRADLLEGVFPPEELDPRLLLSAPYGRIPVSLFVHRRMPYPRRLKDLEGLVVGAVQGERSIPFLLEQGMDSVLPYPDYPSLVEGFAKGRVRAFLGEDPSALWALEQARLGQNFHRGAPLFEVLLRRGVLKKNAALLQEVERGFEGLEADREALLDRWPGQDLGRRDAGGQLLLAGVLAVSLLLALALLLVFFWNRGLKNRVAERTEELNRSLANLHDSEARYSRVLEATHDAFWEHDLSTGTWFRSSRWYTLLGYAPGEIDPDFEENLARIHPDDRDRVRQAFTLHLQGRSPDILVEYRSRHRDGTYRWFLTRGSVSQRDGQGSPTRLSGITLDITERKRDEQDKALLYHLGEMTQEAKTLQELYPAIHLALLEFMRLPNLYLALYDETTNLLHFPYYVDERDDEHPAPMPLGKSPTALVIRTGKPLLLTPETLQPLLDSGEMVLVGSRPVDWLGLPLKTEGRTLGVLAVQSYDEELRFTEEDERVLAFVSGQIAQAIERKQTAEQISYIGFHDAVTGLYNRAFFEEELYRLDTNRNLPLSLLMGDVNGLKLVNDGFGHLMGDLLLQRTAEAIRSACRQEDVVARWGGDEFVVLLPRTPEDQAEAVADRIRETVARIDDLPVQPSIALGVAVKRTPEEDVRTALLRQAEERMYRNKLTESASARSALLDSLKEAFWDREEGQREHGTRMRELALHLGAAAGLSGSELEDLGLVALLHDIGKAALPPELFRKHPLTEEEWEQVRQHPEIGCRIAKAAPDLVPLAPLILSHHERWDGTGYPQGLKGEEIPLISRIVALVDSYDIMTHPQTYGAQPRTFQEALQEIADGAGTQFDPYLARLLLRLLAGGGESTETITGE